MYIYLSYENESSQFVYFDDLKVSHTKSPVIQSNGYYAFGMQTSDSWTRLDAEPNKYLYNSGSELNSITGNYEMLFRSYDPVLGRMNGVDMYADSYSSLTPYQYAVNNPLYWNDPTGAITDDQWWASPRSKWRDGMDPQQRREQARYAAHSHGGGGFVNEQFLGRSGIIDWTLTDAMIGEAYAERFVEAWMGDNVSYYVDPGNNPTSKDPGSPKIHEIREPANVGTTNGTGVAGGSVQFNEGPETPQGGYYSINQVLNQYGYPSREEYLFPKPTFAERLINFIGIGASTQDLAEAVAQAVGNEWDLIHKNLDAVDIERLKRYNDDLWSLRFKLMTQIEQLNSQIAELQSKNLGVMYGAEINSLSFRMWDIKDYLIPVNDEYAQTSKAIKVKTVQ